MAVRKKTTTKRSRKTSESHSITGYMTFGAILILGAAGWYYSPGSRSVEKKQTIAMQQKEVVAPIQKPAAFASDPVLGNGLPRPKIPVPAAAPSIQATSVKPKIDTVVSRPPYSVDRHLPPKGQFAINNAANAIYAQKRTTIYLKADQTSKIVAFVEKGQEMRSYETNGRWHRIVVPSTNIIGWAKDETLTASKSRSGIDTNATSSIK